MPKSTSSVRISRLNRLLITLQNKPGLSRKELLDEVEYTSPRTLERDMRFLREEFGVRIAFLRSKGEYYLEDAGQFVLLRKSGKDGKKGEVKE